VDTVTQQNIASAEESASASEELNAHADSMRKIVQELSKLINGMKSATKDNNDPLSSSLQQPMQVINTIPMNSVYQKSSLKNELLTEKTKTKVISPEDIIPLEKDGDHF
jgi:methyl-accepting chemotaxis protein